MSLKLYDCDIGITLAGVNYDFTHVDSVTHEDPKRNKLIRGANAGNKIGLVYTEGTKEPDVLTTSVIEIPKALHELLTRAFENKTRMDFYCVSRSTGSAKLAKNSILAQKPFQGTIDETPESLNTSLVFESFDVSDTIKE